MTAYIHDRNRLCSRPEEEFSRAKTQNLTFSQDAIINGAGFYTEWIEAAVPATPGPGNKLYARFVVPAGIWMAIDYREIITDKERVFYRVYPTATVTIATTGANIPLRNLRNDQALGPAVFNKVTLTAPPTPGTELFTVPVFGPVNAGNRGSGDVAPDSVFRLLQPGSDFVLEIDNQSTATTYIQLILVFGFIPVAEVPPAI